MHRAPQRMPLLIDAAFDAADATLDTLIAATAMKRHSAAAHAALLIACHIDIVC